MSAPGEGARNHVQKTTEELGREALNREPSVNVQEFDRPYLELKPVEVKVPRKKGDVTVSSVRTPFGPIVVGLAKSRGYSVVFSDKVDPSFAVTAEFNDAQFKDVVRQLAFMAGYVAIVNERSGIITIADEATFTFKLPSTVFQQLNSTYNVGGNPVASGGGQNTGGSQLQAQFTVQGRETNGAANLEKQIKDLAGPNAKITVNETGIVTVRSNSHALKRVSDFMKNISVDAMRQVDIEATVVEVALTNGLELGINWGRIAEEGAKGVIGGAGSLAQAGATLNGGNLNLSADFAGNISLGNSGDGLGAYRVGTSSASLISALAQYTDVKVVSQPRLTAQNNTSSTFFSGVQRPYLGNIQTTANSGSSANGNPTVSGSLSYAIDGISLSVMPSILDDKNISITLIPVLSTVERLDEFKLGADSVLTGARQSNRQSFNKVTMETGKTLIIGGLRYSVDSKSNTILRSVNNASTTKELVILLRANVVPAPDYEPLIDESI